MFIDYLIDEFDKSSETEGKIETKKIEYKALILELINHIQRLQPTSIDWIRFRLLIDKRFDCLINAILSKTIEDDLLITECRIYKESVREHIKQFEIDENHCNVFHALLLIRTILVDSNPKLSKAVSSMLKFLNIIVGQLYSNCKSIWSGSVKMIEMIDKFSNLLMSIQHDIYNPNTIGGDRENHLEWFLNEFDSFIDKVRSRNLKSSSPDSANESNDSLSSLISSSSSTPSLISVQSSSSEESFNEHDHSNELISSKSSPQPSPPPPPPPPPPPLPPLSFLVTKTSPMILPPQPLSSNSFPLLDQNRCPEFESASLPSTVDLLPQKPRTKMKTINWAKIPKNMIVKRFQHTTKINNRSNVWSLIGKKYKENKAGSDDLIRLVDFDELEELFCLPLSQRVVPGTVPKNDASNSCPNSPRFQRRNSTTRCLLDNVISDHHSSDDDTNPDKSIDSITTSLEQSILSVLDSKRSLSINVFLKQYKSSNGFEDLIDWIEAAEHQSFGLEKLKLLKQLLPDTKEQQILIEYGRTNCADRMPLAERFVYRLISIKHFRLKIDFMLLRAECETNLPWLQHSTKSIKEAANELMVSQKLQKILALVLISGNFLNFVSLF